MSDHARAQESIAAAAADGLTAEEAERLDAHLRDCPECARALAEARGLGDKLGSLFAPARPGPALEDRVIQSLRDADARRRVLSGWRRKLAAGVAASVGLGLTGAAVSQLAAPGGLPTPAPTGLAGVNLPATQTPRPVAATGFVDVDHGNAAAMARDLGGRIRSEWNQLPGLVPKGGSPGTGSSVSPGTGTLAYSLPHMDQQPVFNEIPGDFFSLKNNLPAWAYGTAPYDTGGPSGTYPWPAQSYPGNYQLFGTVNNPPSELSVPRVKAYEMPDPALDSRHANAPAQPAPGAVLFPSYIKPTDLKPAITPPESQSTGGKRDGQAAPTGREQGKSSEPTPPPAKPAAPAPAAPAAPAAANPAPGAPRKIVIRAGDMEFEVESFDAAVAAVTRLVTAIDGAFVATVNSEKLPNGKVKGSVVLRVPPEQLDSLVLDLRKELGKAGELKGLRIGSQDITKQYTDLESRLRAARTMEARLLQIIKEGKGEIKQLLEAEKELGVWRTRIEECEGELRYFGNLVALSTLTLTLAEREIRSAAATTENERVQAGVEVEDVDHALQQALAAITEAKGRVTKSELKQLAAGQFNATLHCELAPAAAGPFRDRLNQLGRVARLEIDRVQQSEGGTATRDAKVTQGDTRFLVQFYNTANVAPRESTTLLLAVADVSAGYQSLREAVAKARGRVITSRLDEQDRQNVTAQLDFEVRRADEPAVQSAVAAAGEVVARNVTRAPDGDNLTDAKVLFRAALVSAARVKPRETTTLALEVSDVDAATAVFGAQVAEAKGRVADSQAAHERAGRVTARLVYDVPLAAAPGLVEKFKGAGVARVQQSSRDPQAPDGRFATARLDVTLSNSDLIVPKDDGLWPQVRRGLSFSAAVLLMSVTWVVFGLCVVLPWAVVGYGGYRLFRRLVPRPAAASPTSAPPGT
jgi:hypothetical protein